MPPESDSNPAGPAREGGRQVRFPIALKLISASAGLVLLLSAGFVVDRWIATGSQYAQFSEGRKLSEFNALATRGLGLARSVADSVYAPLLDGDAGRIVDTVAAVSHGDSEILEVIVSRTDGRVIARSGTGVLGETLPKTVCNLWRALPNRSFSMKFEGIPCLRGSFLQRRLRHEPVVYAVAKAI